MEAQMKRIVLLTMFLLAMIVCMIRDARAAPICVPPIQEVRFGFTTEGIWFYWFCVIPDGQPEVALEQRAILFEAITPKLKSDFEAYVAGKNPDFLNTPAPFSLEAPAFAGLVAAMSAAYDADTIPIPPLPAWIVAKNGTAKTRPAFPIVNGKRSYSSDGAVAVGAPCDPSITLIEGSLSFLQVSPAHVAVCSKP